MGLLQTIRFIRSHPLGRRHLVASLGRYARWQATSRLTPGPIAIDFAGGARLLVRRGMTGATGNVYVGLHEFEDMCFVVHALRPGDLFVEVGANVGSYTVLASGVAGANTLALEPGEQAFRWLTDNINLNGLGDRVEAIRVAAGRTTGEILFSTGLDTANHVVGPGAPEPSVSAQVSTLDALLQGRTPVVLKIDVEGYETEAIAGAEQTLAKEGLWAIVMETNGSGERYGFDESQLVRKLAEHGFEPNRYDPWRRTLAPLPRPASEGNTLFVRMTPELRERLSAAAPFCVLGETI